MATVSKEVVKDIRNLIYEITRFGEDEENFFICEQYCMSHVMHHSYPSVNKYEVKKLIDGYILRFYIHGYFKVAEGLDAQVKRFLSSEASFKKNPEYDIQWILLSLLTSLASNLTAVSKLPKMLQEVKEEEAPDEINWGEYLKEGLPRFEYESSNEESDSSTVFDECQEAVEPEVPAETEAESNEATDQSSDVFLPDDFCPSRQYLIDELVKRREREISHTRDINKRGNLIEKLNNGVTSDSSCQPVSLLSEFQVVGCVLKQLLTGENVYKRKGYANASTCSLTQETVKNYMDSIQPYVKMINTFKEFNCEVSFFENDPCDDDDVTGTSSDFSLSNGSGDRKSSSRSSHNGKITETNERRAKQRTIPNVLKLYNLALMEALNSFENKLFMMSEYQNSFTLLDVLNELRPSFNDLSSLYAFHVAATVNWSTVPNWLCSVRIIITLYKALLHSSSNRLKFLYMNMFLHCFQAYLDITDNWVSCLSLNDPHDEYIIYRSEESCDSDGNENSYSVRPYKDELLKLGLKEMPILDFLTEKMVHVGHSIDVLNRLDRSIVNDRKGNCEAPSGESAYKALLKSVKEEMMKIVEALGVKQDDYYAVYGESSSSMFSFTDKSESDSEMVRSAAFGSDDSENNNNNNNSVSSRSFRSSTNKTKGSESEREIGNHVIVRDIALSEFCFALCEIDASGTIEKSVWPLEVIISANVKNVLNVRVLDTCDIAKDVVVNVFQLKMHLRILRNVFLFNDPHLILPFMNALFNQKIAWRNCYVLTMRLKECIESRYRDQAGLLSVSVDNESSSAPRNVLEAIDGIAINYQVDWPLRLIFTPRIMALYNDVFRHFLKLHWAYLTLCKLKFNVPKRGTPESVKSSARRLELLRFWCLSSLTRLRAYFMAQISTPFDLSPSNYQHLKHILKEHEAFVEKIHARCLLDDEATNGRELIFNVLLPLCNDIYQLWFAGHPVHKIKLSRTEALAVKLQMRFPRLMALLEQE